MDELLDIPGQKEDINLKKWLLVFGVILIGAGLIGGGIFVYSKAMSNKNALIISSEVSPSPTPEIVEVSPTPTEEPVELDRKDLSVQVLNGNGAPGIAGTAVKFLEGLGYKDIKTGNAEAYTYPKTVIKITKEKENYLDMVRKDLETKYTLEKETQTLPEDSKFDLVIILGKV